MNRRHFKFISAIFALVSASHFIFASQIHSKTRLRSLRKKKSSDEFKYDRDAALSEFSFVVSRVPGVCRDATVSSRDRTRNS